MFAARAGVAAARRVPARTPRASSCAPGVRAVPTTRRGALVVAASVEPPERRVGSAGARSSSAEGDAAGFDDPLAEQFKRLYPGGAGERIKWGVFKEKVEASPDPPSDEALAERAALREAAACSLTNIDAAERARREKVGKVAAALCGALAVAQLATGAGASQRAVMALPLFFAVGFLGSAETGL